MKKKHSILDLILMIIPAFSFIFLFWYIYKFDINNFILLGTTPALKVLNNIIFWVLASYCLDDGFKHWYNYTGERNND